MVTARDDLADKRTALETGADDFLEKPLDLSKLMAAIQRNANALANASVAESISVSGNTSAATLARPGTTAEPALQPTTVPVHPANPATPTPK